MKNSQIERTLVVNPYALRVIEGQGGEVDEYPLTLASTEAYDSLRSDDLDEWLDSMNEPCDVVRLGSRSYEFKTLGQSDNPETRLFFPTIATGLSNNNGPGNLYEQGVRILTRRRAAEMAGVPALREVYVSSVANGESSALSGTELHRFKSSGRFMSVKKGKTEPFPWISGLQKVMRDAGHDVKHVDGESFGALMANAFAAAQGDMRSVVMNGRPQLVGQPHSLLALNMSYEGRYGTKHNRTVATDPWAVMGDAQKLYARHRAPNVFAADEAVKRPSLRDQYELTKGYYAPWSMSDRDPLLEDSLAMVTANRDAKLLMMFGEHDRQSRGHIPHERAQLLVRALSAASNEAVRMVVINGNHSWHTYNPGVRMAIEAHFTNA